MVAVATLVVSSCSGEVSDPTSTSAQGPATTATAAATTTSSAPATTAAPAASTTASPSTTTIAGATPPGEGVLYSIPVGPDGVEYRGSGDEQEITGPSLLAIDPANRVHIFDPVGGRVLSLHEGGETSIDLRALDILSVTAMAANADHMVLVEIFFQPERNRVHRVGFDGSLIETIELPPGLRLEDGLSGVRSGQGEEILLEFAGGASFAVWDPGIGAFADLPAIASGPSLIVPFPPDLEIGGRLITADLTNGFGGLRYLGAATNGEHLVVREDVTSLDPVVTVVTTIEWYSADDGFVGSARVPPLEDQHISTPPPVAMFSDGQVAALVAFSDEVQVVVLSRQPDRILNSR